MSGEPNDPRGRVDPRIDTRGREGLTGTAPAELYVPIAGREQITIPPDFRSPDSGLSLFSQP